MSVLAQVDQALLTLFDAACVTCSRPLTSDRHGPVCATCWNSVQLLSPPLCVRCAEPLAAVTASPTLCAHCAQHLPAFDGARAAGLYDGSLREIVHALKYGRHPLIAPELARRMRLVAGHWLDDACVVPVPLHPWRSWQRGFNQADLIARALGCPVRRLLWRGRLGRPQAGLTADERRHNVNGVYHVWWTCRPLPQRVVLVDDVLTTGATADACARALKAAGVGEVHVLTAARAVRAHGHIV